MQNPYAWLFLSILTVVSFVFAIYTWFAGKKRKELSVSCKSDIIVKSGKCPIHKLKLSFDGRAIHDLTSSKFYIWNSGNDIINAADIVESRPISIINMDSTLILDAHEKLNPQMLFQFQQLILINCNLLLTILIEAKEFLFRCYTLEMLEI